MKDTELYEQLLGLSGKVEQLAVPCAEYCRVSMQYAAQNSGSYWVQAVRR